jgi:hypothetical protein
MPTFGPVLEVADVIQIVSVTHIGDQAGLNIIHYQVDANNAAAPRNLSALMEAYETLDVALSLKSLLNVNASYRGFRARVLWPTLSIEYISTVAAGAGNVAGDLLPKQVSGFIRKQSALAGRRLSGRFYVPFPGELDNDIIARPSEDYMDRLTTLAVKLTGQLTWGAAGRATPVIVKRANLLATPPTPLQTRGIAAWTPIRKWASQRRRGSFGRPNALVF